MSADLCSLCRGSGNLVSHQDGRREYWTCQACGGAGVRVLYAAPTIRVHKITFEKWRKQAERSARKAVEAA